jgi:hypothetical protein
VNELAADPQPARHLHQDIPSRTITKVSPR